MTSDNVIPPTVEKPARYTGAEANAVRKDPGACRLSVALCFPDTYEVGMSHLGLQILYALLNGEREVAAERCYAPWPDMEGYLRRRGLPLTTLESGTPLKKFDLVGFSLQYELSYTNCLAMLDLGGVPPRRQDRREGDPIVIAGGPCVFNPLPMSPFIDAFVVGEGEEVILEIARRLMRAKERGLSREEAIGELSHLEGVYCPAFHRGEGRIRKRVVGDLNAFLEPAAPVVPLIKTVHDRVVLEIARGCTRGCRFCQAGMVWRPVRERDPAILLAMAEKALAATGHDEISLLSLSAGDYSHIEELLGALMDRYHHRRVALALPSLRVETLSAAMIENIKRVRKTSFTLAPEAGTERLRKMINKGNTEGELLATLEKVYEAGWLAAKLYFMIGLPHEEGADLEGICDLAFKALERAKRRGEVTVNLSTFVPKPHTPFQWERQISPEETREKQEFFKKRLRHRRLRVKWHDPEMSGLEGVFSRGDERLGEVIEKAFLLGCRFDGWGERFDKTLWERAWRECGIDPAPYLAPRRLEAPLPWDFIDAGVHKAFLREEAARAAEGLPTADCRRGPCGDCGACDFQTITVREAAPFPQEERERPRRVEKGGQGASYRIVFAKTGPSRHLSHLDCAAALFRAFCRAGVIFSFSEGFHPHPKMSFPFATAVGMESLGEYGDIRLAEALPDPEALREKVNSCLPRGLEVKKIDPLPADPVPLSALIKGFVYETYLPADHPADEREALAARCRDFLETTSFTVTRDHHGKTRHTDLRPLVRALQLDPGTGRIVMTLAFGPRGTARPGEVLTAVLGIPRETAAGMVIVKKETLFA